MTNAPRVLLVEPDVYVQLIDILDDLGIKHTPSDGSQTSARVDALPHPPLSAPTAPQASAPTDLTASAPDLAADVVGTTGPTP